MKRLLSLCLCALLTLAGCATSPVAENPAATSTASLQLRPSAELQSKPKVGNRAPSGADTSNPLSPIDAQFTAPRTVASLEPPQDLWERIRRGYAMPDLDSSLVSDRERWYTTRPDYIYRMTERSKKYLFHIVEELELRNMPTELALLPFVESAFNPQAVSSAKAAGMWQFMPATGKTFELKQKAFGNAAETYWPPPVPRWITCKSCTACSETGTWPWLPTTGAKAASAAP